MGELMKRASVVLLFSILIRLSGSAQAPNVVSLAKVKTAALVVRATSSVSCGDGSEGTCVRTDTDVIRNVTTIVDGTDLWQHFEKADPTKADVIFEFTLRSAKSTYGSVEFSVRDADTNQILYTESRSIVVLENDIARIVAHFLKVFEDAKKSPPNTKKH